MIAKTGERLGLSETAARDLAIETAVGATQLAQESGDSMDELIARVRSPGGTTAAALDSLLNNGVRDIFATALTAARDRATELADQAHNDSQD
jgi:pyrroline-5-carboxylate reductase